MTILKFSVDELEFIQMLVSQYAFPYYHKVDIDELENKLVTHLDDIRDGEEPEYANPSDS